MSGHDRDSVGASDTSFQSYPWKPSKSNLSPHLKSVILKLRHYIYHLFFPTRPSKDSTNYSSSVNLPKCNKILQGRGYRDWLSKWQRNFLLAAALISACKEPETNVFPPTPLCRVTSLLNSVRPLKRLTVKGCPQQTHHNYHRNPIFCCFRETKRSPKQANLPKFS